MKTAVRAGLTALALALAGTTLPAAPADAATIKQVTSTCHDGDFGGTFTLRYETSGGYHRPIGAITTSGPYIGDSGTRLMRISYREGVTTRTIYTRSSAATNGEQAEAFPTGLTIPITARGTASTTFDSGTATCTATVPIS